MVGPGQASTSRPGANLLPLIGGLCQYPWEFSLRLPGPDGFIGVIGYTVGLHSCGVDVFLISSTAHTRKTRLEELSE